MERRDNALGDAPAATQGAGLTDRGNGWRGSLCTAAPASNRMGRFSVRPAAAERRAAPAPPEWFACAERAVSPVVWPSRVHRTPAVALMGDAEGVIYLICIKHSAW